ncbi:MAG TPA: hypothetical protein VIA18_28150 [Polyangia bacterium]|jgi:hypothetical protein|nr:hypothetical protein [Polyangia bacterium]HWE27543.1 hypothetical protein [Polyangia bacterium]
MQVIIDEIVNNVRAVDREAALSPDTMHKIVAACVKAVRDLKHHDERTKEERSVAGAWALQPDGDR